MNALRPPNQRFIGAWEPLGCPDGELSVGAYERPDGSRHLYFSDHARADAVNRPSDVDATRIVYREVGSQVRLLGLSVEKRMRGVGLGQLLLDHFLENVESETGMPCRRTGRVNKPVMAMTLQRAGFKPASTNILAAVLPKSESGDPDVPRVQIVRNRLGVGRLITQSPQRHWTFYEVVPDEEAIQETLGGQRQVLVALHTHYTKPPRTRA